MLVYHVSRALSKDQLNKKMFRGCSRFFKKKKKLKKNIFAIFGNFENFEKS